MILRFFPGPLDEALNSEGVQDQLEAVAKKVVASARGKKGAGTMKFRTRKGKSRRGAFAQAVMSGEGALVVEFGSRNNRAYAPLRSSLPRR